MMHAFLLTLILLGAGAAVSARAAQPLKAPTPEHLQLLLRKYPAADANRDGVLTLDEAKAYRQKMGGAKRPAAADADSGIAPTHRDIRYGPHERNVMDLWRAATNRPAPLIVFIHGGGFVGGDKSKASPRAARLCLESGVSYAAINYRFRKDAPIQEILRDAARAIQFIRLHASEYGVDPSRIACYGGSAGAGTSLWLATRDDLADPASADSVLRQSTRISAAACLNGQASYDLTQWNTIVGTFRDEWKTEPDEDVRFYHFNSRDDLASEAGKRVLAECDMLRWISKDDPPLFFSCSVADAEPTNRSQYVHHPRHVKAVKARCDKEGEPCEIAPVSGGGEEAAVRFLLGHLLGSDQKALARAGTP